MCSTTNKLINAFFNFVPKYVLLEIVILFYSEYVLAKAKMQELAKEMPHVLEDWLT